MATLSALDATLAELRTGAAALAAALLELDTDANRALLDPARSSGETAARARAVRARFDWLWERHRVLSDVIHRAEALRGDRGWLGPRRVAELEALLHRASVPGQPGRPAAGTPTASTATGSSGPATGTSLYPGDLLVGTTEVIDAVRAGVTATVTACASLASRLATAERRLAELGATAAEHGLADVPELAAARAAVHALSTAAAADPLGVAEADLASMAAAVATAGTTVTSLARARTSLAGDLRAAEKLLAAIVTTAADGERAARATASRVAGAETVLRCLGDGWFDEPRRGLRPWLDRLQAAAAAGDWQRAARGLAAWRGVAEATLTTAGQIVAANAAPLRRRGELRGLLAALQAKAVASGAAELPDLVTRYGRARDALYVAPADLDLADELVRSYAAGIIAGRASTPVPLRPDRTDQREDQYEQEAG